MPTCHRFEQRQSTICQFKYNSTMDYCQVRQCINATDLRCLQWKKKKYNDTILLASSSSSNPPDHHHSLPRCKPPLLLESIDTNSANRFFLALIIIIIVVVVDDIVDAIDTWAHFHITTIELKWQYWPRSLLATILNDWQLRGVYFVCVCLISVWLFFVVLRHKHI